MSNIFKFLLMALAWGLLFLVSYFGCIKPEYCPSEPAQRVESPPATPPVTTPVNNFAVATSTGAATIFTGTAWPADLAGYLKAYKDNPNQQLEVAGYYYASEPKPEGYDNMGFLRADNIKKLLVAEGLPAESIVALSRLRPGGPPAASEKWNAATFNWTAVSATGEAPTMQLIELDKDNIVVRFPFNKSTRQLDAGIESYLQKLAQRIEASGERVTIVGHTDDVGTDAANMRLGQQRANFIKQRLTGYGAPAGQIVTSSQGESQPEARGTTSTARRLNRRAVITLIRKQ